MRALATKGRLDVRCWLFGRTVAAWRSLSARARIGALILCTVPALLLSVLSGPAQAQCFHCSCEANSVNTIRGVVLAEHIGTRTHVTVEFELHRVDFVIDYWFRLFLLNAMMSMTEELTATAMHQMFIVGALLDAKQQLETQRLFQSMVADAHRDYQPSMDMCVFGTMARGLASSQRRGQFGAHYMTQRYLDRQLNNENTIGGEGQGLDRKNRMALFITRHCDEHDNNDKMANLCGASVSSPANVLAKNETVNKDIDYNRLIDMPMTIRADFTNQFAASTGYQEDERDVLAMATNLYANQIPDPPAGKYLKSEGNRHIYMLLRQLAAKRSVAQNTFGAIVGMKLSGSATEANTYEYLRVFMQQMGLTDDDDIERLLGDRPSYNAHMEVLTKKIYQRPEFYTNLYDTPANVERKIASMRAIGLMQDFDTFKSHLRNEALLAVLLEAELASEDDRSSDQLSNQENEGAVQ